MNDPTPKDMQMQIDALKAEVKSLKEFIRALYNMIVEDDEPEYAGGIEMGRFNT